MIETSITLEPPKAIMPPTERIDCRIPLACAGMRLDQALAELLPTYSRNRLQQWLKAGQLRVDGAVRRPRDPVAGSRGMIAALKKVNVTPEPRYTEFPGVGHGSWTPAYATPDLWDWLFDQKRQP